MSANEHTPQLPPLTRRQRHAKSMTDFRLRNAARGMCPSCGKYPPSIGQSFCDRCVERRRGYQRAKALLRRSKRLCRKCHGALQPKQYICDNCRVRPKVRILLGPKVCKMCGESKHRHSFPKDAKRPDGRFPYCKMCHSAYQSRSKVANPEKAALRYKRHLDKARAWKEAHQEEYKILSRRRMLLRRYGITPEQYGQKLEEQGGHCALCDVTPEMEKHGVLAVDHDHSCCAHGKGCGNCFRFLLCFRHNSMLGQAKDDPAILRRAADAIEAWNKERR